MPAYINPSRNVLYFGAHHGRSRSLSLFPDCTYSKSMPVDGVLVINLEESEASPYLARGLLKLSQVAATTPVTAKDVLGKTEVFMSSALPIGTDGEVKSPNAAPSAAAAIPVGLPMPPAPKPAVVEKVAKVKKAKGKASVVESLPVARGALISAISKIKEAMSPKDDPLSDDHPMRARESAQDAGVLVSPEPPVQESVPVGVGPVTSPFSYDRGPAGPLDTTPPAADTPPPPPRRRYSAE